MMGCIDIAQPPSDEPLALRPHPRITTRRLCALALLAAAAQPAGAQPAAEPTIDVAPARAELAEGLTALGRRLGAGANSQAWKAYVGWRTLEGFANGDDGARLVDLQEAIDHLTSGEPGLELAEFHRVAVDARRLFDLLLIASLEDPEQFSADQAAELDRLLASDPKLLDPRDSRAVEQRLDFFQGAPGGQQRAGELFGRFDQPNLLVDVSGALIDRVAHRAVGRTGAVREVILGTRITGTSDTRGLLSVRTLPSATSARLLLSMSGTVHSTTVGVNGPALIHSGGATPYTGTKLLTVTGDAITAAPSTFDATTRTTTEAICKQGGGLGTRLVVAVASKRVAEQKRQAEAIAAQRAELRLRDEFDSEVRAQLATTRRNLKERFLAPLERRHAEPQEVRLSTSDDALSVRVLQAGRGQLAAPDSPPQPPVESDLSLRLHQSAANNLAAAILSGATLRRDSPDQPARLNVPVPEWVRELAQQRAADGRPTAVDNFKPWALTFRRNRPVSLRFTESEVELLIHAARVESGADSFSGWDLILRFEPAERDGRTVLVRKGEIDALPTNFDPRGGGQDPLDGARLTPRQVGFRNNLKAQLNKKRGGEDALPAEINLGPITLREGRGELVAKQLSSLAGWLSVGWDAR